MRVDLTINVPTIISVVASIATVCAFGISIYSDLDKRQMRTDIAVVEIRSRQDKIESAINTIKTDQAVQTQALRNDVKADIGEIKDLLNRLIFGGTPQSRRDLKEWSK